MAQRPGLKRAVAGKKNKASDYNDNFDLMVDYCEDVAGELTTETNTTLSVYQTVNTLATSGTVALTDNSINTIIPAGAVVFTLPAITGGDASKFHQILVQLKLTDTSYVTADDNKLGTSKYFSSGKPIFDTTGDYNLIYEYDNINGVWVVGVVFKEVLS